MEAAAVEIRQFLVPPPLPFPEKVAFTPLLLVNWSGGEGGGIIISPAIASEHAHERARDGRGGGGGGGGGVPRVPVGLKRWLACAAARGGIFSTKSTTTPILGRQEGRRRGK